jgi:hypothetical protein
MKLELIPRALIEELQLFLLRDFITPFQQLKDGIAAYESNEWDKSAELFINIWRCSENAFYSYLHKGLSLGFPPDSLEDELSRGEQAIRAMCWLGIYALYDAATAYFEAPDGVYNAGECNHLPSDTCIRHLSGDTSFGLVIDEGVYFDNKEHYAGAPITNIILLKDAIGNKLNYSKTYSNAAHHVALLCLRRLHMMEVSDTNLLSTEFQVLIGERIKYNLLLVVTNTVRAITTRLDERTINGEWWAKEAEFETLKMSHKLGSKDTGWER